MICGGADEYDTTTVAVFDNLLACSTAFNDTPSRTPRPFDVRPRRPGGGRGRRGRAAGRIRSGPPAGGRHPGRGHRLRLQQQRRRPDSAQPGRHYRHHPQRARRRRPGPGEVDFISAHATATKMGDVIEAQAIHRVLRRRFTPGERASRATWGIPWAPAAPSKRS